MSVDTVEKTDLGEMTAAELSEAFASGKASPVEATQAALARIERFNADVNAFVHVIADKALADAKASEQRWKTGEALSAIDGAPTTIKELTAVKGIPWSRGSVLGDKVPCNRQIEIVDRLQGAGAVILGTTRSPEFGWKGLTHNPTFGNTVNPWNTGRASGGSSGGAAVAAALNMGVLHEGSDGAGSIRIPSSFCGVFGYKSTFGWIPADAPSSLFELAHRGPLTRTVEDAALFLNATTGGSPNALYGWSPKEAPDWRDLVRKSRSVRGLKLAYSRNLGYATVQPDVAAAVERAVTRLSDMGAIVEEIDPGFDCPQDTLLTLWYAAEAQTLSIFSPTDEQKAQMDPGFLKICELGQTYSASDYVQARQARADLTAHMNRFFEKYDALVLPTMPLTAFEAGVDFPGGIEGKDWSDWSPFTYPFNLTGQPACSVPCGFDHDGLPIGLQFVSGTFNDEKVLSLASAYQAAYPEAVTNEVKKG